MSQLCRAIRLNMRTVHYPGIVVAFLSVPAATCAQSFVWVHDGRNLPEHHARGQARAMEDLNSGVLKLYVPICTSPRAEKKQVRSYEIRKALYQTSRVTVMANLCNDIMPNASQQEAYVTGYNAVMDPVIVKRFGRDWKEKIEKQVVILQRKQPAGTLQAKDIAFETPY